MAPSAALPVPLSSGWQCTPRVYLGSRPLKPTCSSKVFVEPGLGAQFMAPLAASRVQLREEEAASPQVESDLTAAPQGSVSQEGKEVPRPRSGRVEALPQTTGVGSGDLPNTNKGVGGRQAMGGWEHGWQHQELGVRSPAQSFLLGHSGQAPGAL